ncbi:MAG TPA: hypothetical protein VEJ38_02525 [Candidatus Acidoferrales bacterium]|nr:hypothetical protein [Candidatus Acidoferrales bacterium]
MGAFWEKLKGFVASLEPRTRKRFIWTVSILFILQLYFVRELIAAELLFGALFAALFVFVGLCYFVGTVGIHGLDWAEAGARVVATTARRGYGAIEELSKKPFRHLRSESAQ